MDISELLAFAVKNKASDLHLSASLPPMIRVNGDIRRINLPPMDHKDVHRMVYDIMNDSQRKVYEETLEIDFSFEIPSLARIRVNAFNQQYGSGAVFRTIPTKVLTLEELNGPPIFKEISDQPRGIVLVTGPTGSGKSTTLYATLNAVSRPEINVITVEDPVEYRLPNINQVQVNPKAGLTFAGALRSILRSDPDVVLLGEIRDHETAQIAIEAALTGHLVLSTLHTNDAPSAITRLIEMGIEPFLVGSALDAVVAQRLARRLCEKCKEPYIPTELELTAARFPWVEGEEIPELFRHVGCSACSKTGYRGRLALHEVMKVSEEIERLAVTHASSAEIAATARRQGMVSLREDGWMKVAMGLTSITEVMRVVA